MHWHCPPPPTPHQSLIPRFTTHVAIENGRRVSRSQHGLYEHRSFSIYPVYTPVHVQRARKRFVVYKYGTTGSFSETTRQETVGGLRPIAALGPRVQKVDIFIQRIYQF